MGPLGLFLLDSPVIDSTHDALVCQRVQGQLRASDGNLRLLEPLGMALTGVFQARSQRLGFERTEAVLGKVLLPSVGNLLLLHVGTSVLLCELAVILAVFFEQLFVVSIPVPIASLQANPGGGTVERQDTTKRQALWVKRAYCRLWGLDPSYRDIQQWCRSYGVEVKDRAIYQVRQGKWFAAYAPVMEAISKIGIERLIRALNLHELFHCRPAPVYSEKELAKLAAGRKREERKRLRGIQSQPSFGGAYVDPRRDSDDDDEVNID